MGDFLNRIAVNAGVRNAAYHAALKGRDALLDVLADEHLITDKSARRAVAKLAATCKRYTKDTTFCKRWDTQDWRSAVQAIMRDLPQQNEARQFCSAILEDIDRIEYGAEMTYKHYGL